MSEAVRQLGRLLVDGGGLEAAALEEALARADGAGIHPARVLLQEGRVRPDEVLRVAAERLGIEYFDPGKGWQPNPDALDRLDPATATGQQVLPLRREGSDGLVVAVADPMNRTKLALVAKLSRCRIVPALGSRSGLEMALALAYGPTAAPASQLAAAEMKLGDATVDGEDPGYHLNQLLELVLESGSSDLHLTAGSPPLLRLNGEIQPIPGYDRLMPGTVRTLIYTILSGRQREKLEERRELDCSHPVVGRGRFRVNVYFQRGSVGAALRAIPEQIMSLEELGMPPIVGEFARLSRGLVLVTGATGQGKSTTLASVVDLINRTRAVHVITVEDPIEYMHRHKAAVVNQREVGTDTLSFASALKHALRQDPDVILVGELRDLETIATALTAAETGHLVFGTLHTQDAPGTVQRIIDVFPSHQQQQVRVQLAGSIQGVVCQQLLPTLIGEGRVAAVEVMVATPAVRNLIREGKVHQIRTAMQSGGKHGMHTMEQSLAQLVRAGRVSMAAATERATNPEELLDLLGRGR
ncbi:MAG: PilT/PilU family type 4a pilus ATPase [Actinomycetota bacterium]